MKLTRLNLLHCLCLMNSPINNISFVLYFVVRLRPAVAKSCVFECAGKYNQGSLETLIN